MLQNLKAENSVNSIHDYFHIIQVIYSCCLQELIRQISLDCKERGSLLKKIWNAYISILENAIFEEVKTQQEREKEYLEEITKVHKMYQQVLENNKNFVDRTREENLKLAEIAKNYKENQKFLKRAYRHFEKEFKLMKRDLEYSYNEQKVLVDENNRLKKMIEMITEENNQKSQAMDRLFINAEKVNQEIKESEEAEKKEKRKKRAQTMNKRPIKEVTFIPKESKYVDTTDLIFYWDTEVNTDIVYGAKKFLFIEKSTQTLDRNQFLRESRILEDEIEEMNRKSPKTEQKSENQDEKKYIQLKENEQIPSELIIESEDTNLIESERPKKERTSSKSPKKSYFLVLNKL